MSTHMASVNISIRKDAYNFLKALKTKDKSFSDVILELKDKKRNGFGDGKSLLKYAGVLKDSDWDSVENRMKSFRESFNKRMKETREYMEKSRKEIENLKK